MKKKRGKRCPDLRILALADAKLLPPEVQEPFDQWRIRRARDAVVSTVRKRPLDSPMLQLFLERLEAADDEAGIFEGIYALAETVEMHRSQLGLHSHYVVLIMSGQLNPWGLLCLNRDFDHPASSVIQAAEELWRLVRLHAIDVESLLARVNDEILVALNAHYRHKGTSSG